MVITRTDFSRRLILAVFVPALVVALGGCGGKEKPTARVSLDNYAFNGDTVMLAKALADGADANTLNDSGATALMLAGRNGQIAAVRILVAKGADANIRDKNGRTALLYALAPTTQFGDIPGIVRILLDGGAEMSAKEGLVPPLVSTAYLRSGYLETARLLVSRGAHLESRDAQGRTTLHLAIQFKRVDLVQLLVGLGADVNAKDNGGRSAVNYAMKEADILRILFTSGARPR